jgi:hypothetical protein
LPNLWGKKKSALVFICLADQMPMKVTPNR